MGRYRDVGVAQGELGRRIGGKYVSDVPLSVLRRHVC